MKENFLNIAENLSKLASNSSINITLTLQDLPAVACFCVGAGTICFIVYDTNRTKLLMSQKESEDIKNE